MGDTVEHQDSPQEGAQRSSEATPREPAPIQAPDPEEKRRFNPFAHEDDMFKVVLWAGAICLTAVLLVTLARATL